MVKMIRYSVPALFLCLFFNPAVHAQGVSPDAVDNLKRELVRELLPNCVDVTSYFDQVYCAGKIDAILDDELNAVYSEVRQSLSSSERSELQAIQKRWVEARGLECARIEGKSVILNLGCSTQRTVESIWYLRAIGNGSTFALDIGAYEAYVQSLE